jgi:hypothetical protein
MPANLSGPDAIGGDPDATGSAGGGRLGTFLSRLGIGGASGGGAQSDGSGGGLMSAFMPENKQRQFMSSIAGGLSGMDPSFKAGAFGKGMGGAISAGQKQEDNDTNQRLKLLDAAIKAKAQGDNTTYKNALTDYYKALTAKAQGGGDDSTGTGKTSATERIIASLMKQNPGMSYQDALTLAKRGGGNNDALGKERLASAAAARDPNSFKNPEGTLNKWRQYYGASGPAPTPNNAPAPNAPSPAPANKPAELSFQGQGTRESPYMPKTKDDYDEIESGTYYINPADGNLRLKK